MLTTDGYWNNNGEAVGPVQIDGKTLVGNTDNVVDIVNVPPFVDRSTTGTLDALGTSTTVTTPTVTVEQQACTGTAATTFGSNSGTQSKCACAAGQSQVVQRTTTQSTNATFVEGIAGATTSSASYAFQTISACTTPQTSSIATTGGIRTEYVVCSNGSGSTKNVAITFSDKASYTCANVPGKQSALVTQTKTGATQTTLLTNGVPTSTSFDNPPNPPVIPTYSVSGFTSKAPAVPKPNTSFAGGTVQPPVILGGTALPALISPNPAVTAGLVTSTSVPGGTPNTLADVAMYYYKTDLRQSGPYALGNVPSTTKDFYQEQHMTTFTLGLGLQGNMNYTSTYENNSQSDFGRIKSAANGCPWSGAGTCDWPAVVTTGGSPGGTPAALDDLWHAAVNGRGVYYSASDPNSLVNGLAGVFAALKTQTASASSAAASNPNLTQTDNFLYSSTFRTVAWDSEIVAYRLDPATGALQVVLDPVTKLPVTPVVWSADAQLNAQVQLTSDARTIWTLDPTAASKLKPFLFANLSASATPPLAAEQSFFANQCLALSQCPLLTPAQQTAANDGTNMVNYLRGQKGNEGTLYRLRANVLGDTINAVPAYVRVPSAGFLDLVTPSYLTFQTANASRQAVLYVAANDGMLHAFNGDTGAELWAYVPTIVFPLMARLATDTWDVQHKYLVDGSPQTGDVYDVTAKAWKTILVGGLNSGGSGFYALDITDPANPKGLWQFCNDSTLCATSDANMGLSFGSPIITKRKLDGKWVVIVTSGINNAAPAAPSGNGQGWLYVLDAITGAVLDKATTGAGSTTTPSGFAKISAYADNFNIDNTALYVYGGDLLGNLWRFDLGVSPPAALLMATLKDSAGKPQSITTRPELGLINSNRVVFIGTGRYLGLSDVADPITQSPPLPWAYNQSLYAIKDNNASYGDPRSVLIQQTLVDTGGTTRTTSKNPVNFAVNAGWFVDFNPANTSPGERVNIDPQLVLGTLVLQTNIPNNNACTVGGDSFLYQFDYASGQYVSTATGQVVAQKTYGQLGVGFAIVRTNSGVIKAEQSFSGGKLPVTAGIFIGSGKGAGRRVSWRELLAP